MLPPPPPRREARNQLKPPAAFRIPVSGWQQLLAGRLLPHLELAPLPLGLALYESGSEQEYAYFPTTSIVSLLNVTQDGSSAEIAVVGNEGVVGIAPLLGGETTTSCAVVQSSGYTYRLRASVLKEEFDRGGQLQRLLLRYTRR